MNPSALKAEAVLRSHYIVPSVRWKNEISNILNICSSQYMIVNCNIANISTLSCRYLLFVCLCLYLFDVGMCENTNHEL